MGLSCGMSLVKYGLFVFNLITALAGIALITSGSIALVRIGDISDAFQNSTSPTHMPIALIVLGAVIFVISFFGCCGAIRESQCMVTTYAVFLLLLIIGVIVCAILVFAFKDEVKKEGRRGFDNLWNNRNDVAQERAVHAIQKALQCCGRNGPLDWAPSIPPSCCQEGTTSCQIGFGVNTKGCHQALDDLINGSSLLLAWISIGFGIAMFIGLVFACCLANSIRNVNRRSAYA